MGHQLDATDVKILDLLQHDATKSVADIASHIRLSHNACWRRINQLTEEGYIRCTVALLNAEMVDAGLTIFVSIRAAEHSEKWLKTFSAAVNRVKEVVEFYRLSGDVDYLLKVRVKDIPAFDRVYKQLIREVKITDVTSFFAMEEIKNTTCIPLPELQE